MTATLPTHFMPDLDGGNSGGFIIGQYKQRQSLGGIPALLARLTQLGIALGNPNTPLPERTLAELRATIDSSVTIDWYRPRPAEQAIKQWVKKITEKETISEEDLAYFDGLQREDLASVTANISQAMVQHSQLRAIYLDEYVKSLEAGPSTLAEAHRKSLTLKMIEYRLPEKSARQYAPRVEAVIVEALKLRHTERTLRLILIGVAFGIDPVPYLEQLDFTDVERREVYHTLYMLSRAACTTTQQERTRRMPDIARLLAEIAEHQRVRRNEVEGILRVLRINGMEDFAKQFATRHLSEREVEDVMQPFREPTSNDPKAVEKAKLEFGCGRSKSRVIFVGSAEG